MRTIVRIFILCACVSLLSCGKEELKQIVPWAPVFFKVNLKNLDNTLIITGNSKTFTTPRLDGEMLGLSGLLIFNSSTNPSDGTPILLAFDLCCPYERMKDVKVVPQAGGKAKCDKCGSVYNLYSGGNPESGPSKSRLQLYQATPERPYNGIFRITR